MRTPSGHVYTFLIRSFATPVLSLHAHRFDWLFRGAVRDVGLCGNRCDLPVEVAFVYADNAM